MNSIVLEMQIFRGESLSRDSGDQTSSSLAIPTTSYSGERHLELFARQTLCNNADEVRFENFAILDKGDEIIISLSFYLGNLSMFNCDYFFKENKVVSTFKLGYKYCR